MKKYILGAVFSFVLLSSPLATHATTLTDAQVQSVLSLLSSFGVDQSVINKVSVTLTGNASAPAPGVWCHTFKTNLKVGVQNKEVAYLVGALIRENLLLQGDDAKMVMNNQEIHKFDEKVASAVTGFQQKYASDILTPNGLKYGTGYVGASTLAKLNRLYGCGNQTLPVMPMPTPSAPTISYISPTSAKIGDTVTIYGTNLYGNAPIVLDGNPIIRDGNPININNPSSQDPSGNFMTFVVPSNVSIGSHTVQIAQKVYGTLSNSVMLNVVAVPVATPSISVTYPNKGAVLNNQGGVITNVTWTSNNVSDHPIEIDLLNTQGVMVKHVALGLQNTGSYRWSYDSTIPSGNYTLLIGSQVKEGTSGAGYGRSDTFSIITNGASSTPVISSVNGPFSVGSMPSVSGQHFSGITSVSFTSVTSGQTYSSEWNPDSDTSIRINMPDSSPLPVGQYYLYVTSPAGMSNKIIVNVVAQATTPSVTVTSPNGGERFWSGASIPVTWTANYDSSSVHVYLFTPSTNSNIYSSPALTSVNGSNSYTLPAVAYSQYGDGQYYIKVCESSQAFFSGAEALCDLSDASFGVVHP